MKRKILSLALTLMMIVSVAAAMPVSAENYDFTLDIADDVSDKSANSKSESPIDAPDWVTPKSLAMNTASPYITWTFDVPATGAYDVYVAYACNAQKKANVYVGDSVDIPVEYNLPLGYISTDGNYDHPVITKIATSVPFVKGADNKLKLSVAGGAVYNLRFEYVSATDFVVPARSTDISKLNGANKAGADTGVDWGPKSGFWWSKGTSATYNVNVLEEGDYKLEFLAGAQNGTLKVNIYDNDKQVISNFSIVGPASTYQVSTTDIIHFTEGPHTIRLDRKSGGTYFMGFRFVYQQPVTRYTITAVAIPAAAGTVTPATSTVEEGETVTLTATANSGYLFDGWVDENGESAGDTAEITVTATADKEYTAQFKISPYVDVPLNGSSTINGNPYTNQTGSTTTTTPTGDVEWATPGGMALYSGAKYLRGFVKSFEVPQAGYYDVYVAAGVDVASPAQVYVGGDVVEGTLSATSSSSVAAASKMNGSVYLKEGTNTVTLYVYSQSTNGCKLYDMRFERCEVQPANKDIIINAANWDGKTYIDSYTFRAISSDSTPGQWTPTGALETKDNSYTVYVPTSGYYNVYVSAATGGPSAKCDIFANGVKYADDTYLTNSETTNSYDMVAETCVAKVYLKAGDNVIKYGTGFQSGSGCWLYGLKLSKTNDTLIAGELKLVGNGGSELSASVYKDTMVYGEIVTSQDAKIYVVNYQGSGANKKMVDFTEGTAVVTDNGLKIIRTSSLKAATGTVKVFLWSNDDNYTPLTDFVEISVTNPPAAE